MDLRRGNHVENSDSDGAIALPQPGDSVRHGLEAGLPRALDTEGDLVAAGVSRGSGAPGGERGGAYTASTQIVHWIGLSFMALCVEQLVWNCTSTHVCNGVSRCCCHESNGSATAPAVYTWP